MSRSNRLGWCALVLLAAAGTGRVAAQTPADLPGDYRAVLTAIGKTGDYRDGVLKVNIPRGDIAVTIAGQPAPTPLGFGGWIALTKGDGGHDVMMGDLVLTEDEVNPVMSAVLENGLDVTALHNHFFRDQPRMYYMHVHGVGTAADIARRMKPAVDLIDRAVARAPVRPASPAPSLAIDGAALSAIIGHPGETTGAVYKITIGRPDIVVREHGARITARMAAADLFVVYNHNIRSALDRWFRESNQLLIKVQYAWRR